MVEERDGGDVGALLSELDALLEGIGHELAAPLSATDLTVSSAPSSRFFPRGHETLAEDRGSPGGSRGFRRVGGGQSFV